jgi:hypothetical protein
MEKENLIDFRLDGLTESDMVRALQITWPELRRWQDDGRFPAKDVKVLGIDYINCLGELAEVMVWILKQQAKKENV